MQLIWTTIPRWTYRLQTWTVNINTVLQLELVDASNFVVVM